MLGHLRNEIATQYARNAGTHVELEARFGEFRGQDFQAGITLSSFQRINDFFAAHATPVRRLITDHIQGDIRRSTVVSANPDEPETTSWIRKVRVWNHDVYDYNLRLSMAREEPIAPVADFNPTVVRVKDRRTYTVFDGTVQIDLTTVTNNNRYEVEVELLRPEAFALFEKGVLVTLKRILNTVELYTAREANTMVGYINALMGGNRPYAIDNTTLVQARNLKIRDMVAGGLIDNPETMYTVTHKADGERRLLVFHESGIWLAMAPKQLNRVSKASIPQLHGTILDGEDIPLAKRLPTRGGSDATHWYLVFDCVARQGTNSIQSQPHSARMRQAQNVADLINAIPTPAGRTRLLEVTTKTFRQFLTATDFYAVMDEMFAEQSQLSYHQDGFMFTPGLTPYNPHSDRNPLYQRNLTRMPDICKWKPKSQLTIDFQLQWGPMSPAGRTLLLLAGAMPGAPGPDLVAFAGTMINPFDGATMIDTDHPLTQGANNGSIVEYAWDFERKLLYPVRIRHEKARPNRLDIAQDVWDDIHHPIEEATLRGNDFTLVFAYHNRIKRGLYDFATSDRKVRTLLDIGSGRGGDVAKWKHFQRVVAVEPNEEHVVELRRRIEVFGMTDRVRIVVAGGQETERISAAVREFLGGPADVVSMMLSLSFFWQSPGLLDALVTTIQTNLKPQGKFVFLTIDGDAVQQLFDPMFRGLQVSEMNLTSASLRYAPPQLYVNLPGTIVGDQTEWLVRFQDLLRRNFSVLELHRADEEQFLSAQEIIYTKMYTYGAMIPGAAGRPALPTQLPVLAAVLPPVPVPTVSTVQLPRMPLQSPGGPAMAPVSPGVVPTWVPSPGGPAMAPVSPGIVPTLIMPQVRSPVRQPVLPTVPLPLPLSGAVPKITLPPSAPVPTLPLGLPPVPTLPRPTSGRATVALPTVPLPLPMASTGRSPALPTVPVPVMPTLSITTRPSLPLIPGGPGLPNIQLPTIPALTKPLGLPTIPSMNLGLPPIPTLTLPNLTLPPTIMARPLVPQGPVTLASLPVMAPRRLGEPGIGDNAIQPLRVPWYEHVVRIAAIGDGSCFFHSVCGAYLASYQNNPSYAYRADFIARLRRDMAYLLELPSPDAGSARIWELKEEIARLTGKPAGALTFYDTAANGALLEFYSQQAQGFDMRDDDGVPIDFSLAGMQRLFNSTRDVGYEVYQYVADLLGIDIFVTIGYTDNLRPFNNTRLPTREPRPAVVIVGNRYHYEVVGLQTPQGIQTVFYPGHPFIEALMAQRA